VGKKKKKVKRPVGQEITAKPTTYRGITFRSRLEARWAIYFDNHPLIDDWTYEPRTFKDPQTGWEYTPDFVLKMGTVMAGWLEVKPLVPTEETLKSLQSFVPHLPNCQGFHLALGYGSFYQKEEPLVFMLGAHAAIDPKTVARHAVALSKVPILGHSGAVKVAKDYRFDLPEKVPASRKPGGKTPWDYWRNKG